MEKFKGTKGNWKLGNHFSNIVSDEKPLRNGYREEDFESEKEYYGGYIVCESVSKKADAQLIASAPEMLEALQIALGDIDAHPKRLTFSDKREIMRKAVNKALGE